MAAVSFHVEKKDLEGGLVHPPDTLLLRLKGPEAKRANREALTKTLKLDPSKVKKLYRFEDPLIWFLQTTKEVGTSLVNRLFGSIDRCAVHVTPLDTKIYVTLHWLSTNISEKKVMDFFIHLAEPGALVTLLTGKDDGDKRMGLIEPRKGTELPHYLNITYEDDPKLYRVLVTVPGRRQKCYRCGEDTHWPGQCRSNPTRSYAQVTSSNPPQAKQPTGAPSDDNTGVTPVVSQKNKTTSKSGPNSPKTAEVPPRAVTSPPPLMALVARPPTPEKKTNNPVHKSPKKGATVKATPEPRSTQEADPAKSSPSERQSGRSTKRGRDSHTSTSDESPKRANREGTPLLSPPLHMASSDESTSEATPGSSPGKLVVDFDRDKDE